MPAKIIADPRSADPIDHHDIATSPQLLPFFLNRADVLHLTGWSASELAARIDGAELVNGEHWFHPGGDPRNRPLFTTEKMLSYIRGSSDMIIGMQLEGRPRAPRDPILRTGHGRTCEAPSSLPGHIRCCLRCYRRAAATAAGNGTREDGIGFVYAVEAENGLVKIGKAMNPAARFGGLKTSSAIPLTIVHAFPARDAIAGERALHRRFAERRRHGEWFHLGVEGIAWVKRITFSIGAAFYLDGVLCSVCDVSPHFHWLEELVERAA